MEILFNELCAPPIRTKIWLLATHGDFCMLILTDSSRPFSSCVDHLSRSSCW